jgi:rhamnulokinase
MDAKTATWSEEILDPLGIPRNVLPEIVEPGATVGKLSQPLEAIVGLTDVALIATAAHDTACAFAAAPVDDPERALIISSGTWSLVGKLIPTPITNAAAFDARLSNEGGIGNTRLLRNCMGTWLVQELRRIWALSDGCKLDWNEITAMAKQAEAFSVVLDPDHESFFNPTDMEAAIRQFCTDTGQHAPETRSGLLRSVYESLALRYRWVNDKLCEVSGTDNDTVHIVGGGCKNALLNQFTADAMGLPVVAGPEEATVVGNFMVQAMGLGAIGGMRDAQTIIKNAFPIKRFDPADRTEWDKAYNKFLALIAE